MAQRDLTEKNLEYYPDVFADIINTLLYGGKPILTAAGLQPAPTETLYPGTSACLRNQFQDVSKYEMDAERVKIQYTMENETKAKRKIILRKAGYEGALYRNQVEQKKLMNTLTIPGFMFLRCPGYLLIPESFFRAT